MGYSYVNGMVENADYRTPLEEIYEKEEQEEALRAYYKNTPVVLPDYKSRDREMDRIMQVLQWAGSYFAAAKNLRVAVDVFNLVSGLRRDEKTFQAIALRHGLTRQAIDTHVIECCKILNLPSPVQCKKKGAGKNYRSKNRRNVDKKELL